MLSRGSGLKLVAVKVGIAIELGIVVVVGDLGGLLHNNYICRREAYIYDIGPASLPHGRRIALPPACIHRLPQLTCGGHFQSKLFTAY